MAKTTDDPVAAAVAVTMQAQVEYDRIGVRRNELAVQLSDRESELGGLRSQRSDLLRRQAHGEQVSLREVDTRIQTAEREAADIREMISHLTETARGLDAQLQAARDAERQARGQVAAAARQALAEEVNAAAETLEQRWSEYIAKADEEKTLLGASPDGVEQWKNETKNFGLTWMSRSDGRLLTLPRLGRTRMA